MAQTTTTFDATKPFYAFVGAGDAAVELLLKAAGDVQERLHETDFDELPNRVVAQTRSEIDSRIDELVREAKKAQRTLEARYHELSGDIRGELQGGLQGRITRLQGDAKSLSTKAQGHFSDAQGRITHLPEDAKELTKQLEGRLAELQSELSKLPGQLEAQVAELRKELHKSVGSQQDLYTELAERGRAVVAKLREQDGEVEVIVDPEPTLVDEKPTTVS